MAKIRTAAASAIVDLFGGPAPADAPRTPPTEFPVFAYGINHSDQGDFLFDQISAAQVMAEYDRRQRDLVIDYEHQSLRGGKALAAGWFVPQVRSDGLWATSVRWTAEAADEIGKAQYRYISPVFDYEIESGRITAIKNIALTNNPSLFGLGVGLVAASSKYTRTEELMGDDNDLEKAAEKTRKQLVELKQQLDEKDDLIRTLRGETATAQLSSALGLPMTAKPEEIRTSVVGLAQLRTKLRDLTGKESDAAALGAVEAWKSEAGEASKLKAEKEQLETAACVSEIKSILDKASEAGKVPPGKRQGYETKALNWGGGKATREGVEWLKGFVDDLPVIATGTPASATGGTAVGGGSVAAPPASNATGVLSQTGVKIAEQSGADPAAVGKWVAEQVAAGRLQ